MAVDCRNLARVGIFQATPVAVYHDSTTMVVVVHLKSLHVFGNIVNGFSSLYLYSVHFDGLSHLV